MKTWAVMYALIWASFLQIFLIVFLLAVRPSSGLYYNVTIGLHVLIGLVVIVLAGIAFRLVRQTACPDRIKRISKTTAILGGVQGLLGVILLALIHFNINGAVQNFVLLVHVVNALAMISQASSSATAFDMWEEKEFETPSTMKQPL